MGAWERLHFKWLGCYSRKLHNIACGNGDVGPTRLYVASLWLRAGGESRGSDDKILNSEGE